MGEGLCDGCVEFLGAVVVEQTKKSLGQTGDQLAALDGGLEELFDIGDGVTEASDSGLAESLSFLSEERGDVLRILYPLVAIKGTAVARDLDLAIKKADCRRGCDKGQRAADGLMRDGIVVLVEAHVDGLI